MIPPAPRRHAPREAPPPPGHRSGRGRPCPPEEPHLGSHREPDREGRHLRAPRRALAPRGGAHACRGGRDPARRRRAGAQAPPRAGQDARPRAGRGPVRPGDGVPRDRPLGRPRHVQGVGGRAGRGRGRRHRHRRRAGHGDRRQRRHGQGGSVVPHDLQEGAAGPRGVAGEPAADHLPGGLGRRLPAHAGGHLPGQGALRPRLLQQRPHVGGRRLPDGRDHGLVRGRRGVPPDHERREPHRRGDRLDLPRRLPPGEGGDRRGDRQRGAGRRRGPDRHLRGGRPPPPGRRLVHRQDPQPVRPARRGGAGAVRAPGAGRSALPGRGALRRHADGAGPDRTTPRRSWHASSTAQNSTSSRRPTAGRCSAAPAGSAAGRWESSPTSARSPCRRPAPARATRSSRSAA